MLQKTSKGRRRRLRQDRPADPASYRCFVRKGADAAMLVAASRFPGASENPRGPGDGSVPVSPCLQAARPRELLTGRAVPVEDGAVSKRQLFADLPVPALVPA